MVLPLEAVGEAHLGHVGGAIARATRDDLGRDDGGIDLDPLELCPSLAQVLKGEDRIEPADDPVPEQDRQQPEHACRATEFRSSDRSP